jgi:hypothetical protein
MPERNLLYVLSLVLFPSCSGLSLQDMNMTLTRDCGLLGWHPPTHFYRILGLLHFINCKSIEGSPR